MTVLENINNFIKFSPIPTLVLYPDEAFTVSGANTAFLGLATIDLTKIIGKSILRLLAINNENRRVKQMVADKLFSAIAKKEAFKITIHPGDIIDSTIFTAVVDCDIFPMLNDKQEVVFIGLQIQNSSHGLVTNPIYEEPIPNENYVKHLSASISTLENYYEKMAGILESIGDGFFAVDLKWTVTYWNIEAERIFRIPRHRIIGKNIWEIYHRTGPYKKHLSVSNDVTTHLEEYFPLLDLWIEASVFPSEDGYAVYFQDISERKQIAFELTEEKLKYQDLFNLSPLPQYIYEVESLKFLDVNQAAIQAYGYSKAEFLEMNLTDIRPAEDLEIMYHIINEQVVKGQIHQSNVRHVKKNGHIIQVNAQGNSISFRQKHARLVIIIDQTEKLETLKLLEYNEQRFKILVQEGSDLISIVNLQGVYQYVNPNSKAILGVDADFYIGKSVFDFVHYNDQEEVNKQLASILIEHRVEMAPFRFKVGNEDYRWIETVLTNMIDNPAINGIIANSRDVTERITSQLKMKESIERFNIVSKATSDAIWDWDIHTDEVILNKGIKGIFGYNETNFSHDWWYEKIHPEDLPDVRQQIQSSINEERSVLKAEYRFRCSDGQYKYVLDRSFLLFDNLGHPVRMIGSMQDVTEITKHMEAIQKQNIRLKEISWMQSHAVRSPLARIIGLTRLISSGGMDQTALQECLTYLSISANELDQIIWEIVKKAEKI